MALLDILLDRTGSIGATIRSKRLEAARDQALLRRPKPPTYSYIQTQVGTKLVFDAATDIDFPTKVTSYPVEDKASVSDHKVNENPVFSISGVFSEAMLDVAFTQNTLTHNQVRDALLAIRDSDETVILRTPLDISDDLVLTNLSFPKSAGQGVALYVDMTFEKIRRVSNELTTVFVGSSSSSGDTNKTQSGDTAINNAKEKSSGNKQPQQASEGIISKVFLNENTSNPIPVN
jgi:hypothetical protein